MCKNYWGKNETLKVQTTTSLLYIASYYKIICDQKNSVLAVNIIIHQYSSAMQTVYLNADSQVSLQ